MSLTEPGIHVIQEGLHHSPYVLTTDGMTIDELVNLAYSRQLVAVDDVVHGILKRSRAVVERVIERGDQVYGLTTHLGHRRNETITSDELTEFQEFVVKTHAAAIGEPLEEAEVRAVMLARIAGLARGGAGISVETFDALVALFNSNVVPSVPSVGSIGAADLTPLAAIAEVLIGRGHVRDGGFRIVGDIALKQAGLSPLTLQAKDALSLVSSNAVSIGLGALMVGRVGYLARLADAASALTLEAIDGNLSPFAAIVAMNKPSLGMAQAAAHIRLLLGGSRLEQPGVARNVQDALSLRTVPQVHGALRDQIGVVRSAIEVELNAASDNPVVSLDDESLVSNGNFTPMTMAIGFEALRIAIAHVGALSERRLHKLLAVRHVAQQNLGNLQTFGHIPNLVVNAAAGLLAELKHAAYPVTLATTSLNFDVEDHQSLAPQAVDLTKRAALILERMLAIELLLAFDTLDARQDLSLQLGVGTQQIFDLVSASHAGNPHLSDVIEAIIEVFREQDA